MEALVARDPQVILATDHQAGFFEPESLAARPGWSSLRAVREHRIHLLEADIVLRCGPRLIQALDAFSHALYPDYFPLPNHTTTDTSTTDTSTTDNANPDTSSSNIPSPDTANTVRGMFDSRVRVHAGPDATPRRPHSPQAMQGRECADTLPALAYQDLVAEGRVTRVGLASRWRL
jgi:hypothetical protein